MPIFDYLCNNCGQAFEVMIKNEEKDKIQCPQCLSKDVKQQLSSFFSSEKSKAVRGPAFGCEGCAAARG